MSVWPMSYISRLVLFAEFARLWSWWVSAPLLVVGQESLAVFVSLQKGHAPPRGALKRASPSPASTLIVGGMCGSVCGLGLGVRVVLTYADGISLPFLVPST
jgi:hypothetical protein